jgi:hypothetical protein
MAETPKSKFVYVLNTFEHASQAEEPARNGYAEKRRAVMEYVRNIELGLARRDALLHGWLRYYYSDFSSGFPAPVNETERELGDSHD